MNVNLAITMTCMVNSTAVALAEEAAGAGDMTDNVTLLSDELIELGGSCSSDGGTRAVLDYGRMNKKLVFMLCVANKALINLLLPYLASHYGIYAVFAARFLLGAGESFIYPCINTIVANWFPMDERSTAVALFTTAAMGALWCVAWMLLGSNTPDECRMMKMEERLFLKRNAVLVRENNRVQTPPVPWLKILTNKAFIAHLVATWILTNVVTIMMVYLPTYFKDVLLLGVIMNGTFTSLPMMFNFMFKLTWGVLVDKLKGKKILTQTLGVKISQCFRESHVIHASYGPSPDPLFSATFGVAMGLIPVVLLVSCQRPALALVLFCFTNLCLGAHTSGAYTSLLSLAPQFTPTLSSISVSMSMLAQLTTPFMVAVVNKTGTMQEWNNLFLITALMCVFSGAFFLIFGSGDVQEFARSQKDLERSEDGNLLSPHQRASALRADSVSML
ncbi:transporter, major facilitator family protein [Ancylostoma ceylanicum]|uniref:Transporter, major facilitator family protein n=1 Tax=Ancylostoma ceylanicum TaxID=53326 RepID=A0A0D6LDN2_9BILA|nr:transporter, major facilitator family protein [Ancylostoma ceylanicum]